MQLTVDLDADVYDFASAYAGAKRLTLSQALSELVRRAEKAQEPEVGSSRLRMNEYGYYEIVATGEPLTVEMVKEASEDELIRGSRISARRKHLDRDSGEKPHHKLVRMWFYASPRLQWHLCAFTEAGFLRNATAPRAGQISLTEATLLLRRLTEHSGYRYQPIDTDWQDLCSPFFPRLSGTKQITDAYLLGLAVRHSMVLATLDQAILPLAGTEYSEHVLLLKEK